MVWIDNKKAYGIVLENWIIDCFKIYKISYEVINFIEKAMKTRKVELTAEGRSLAETKVQRGIFQGDAFLRLLFIIVMMLLNHILRKCRARYKLSKSRGNIKNPEYINDIKMFATNGKKK